MKIEYDHGWRLIYPNWQGVRAFNYFATRIDGMRWYVYQFEYETALEIAGRDEFSNEDVIPIEIVRKLWRNAIRRGEIRLVKATEIYCKGWIAPFRIDSEEL